MYPISDLTAFCRRTTGDVPPRLVGASTTVVGSRMYLYGGRLVSERRMVSDIYKFDMETFIWTRLTQDREDDIPQARYFHSADTWRNHLIIFGGMAIKPQSENPEDLCVLNDVRLFDLTTGHWVPASTVSDPATVPNARYAHLSSVTGNRLFIIGGQDLANVWLDDIHTYDLAAQAWVQRRDYSRHCGTYRSVAVTADLRVRLPQEEMRDNKSPSRYVPTPSRARAERDEKDEKAPTSPTSFTSPDSQIHLPYSAPPTDEYPCDIFLFSNYNFTEVQRELEVFTPLPDNDFTISDRSGSMSGTYFPPGLRFPTGAILGTYFIVAGTYLSQQYQSFSIWALDLISMNWSRIDPGSALASGSWFRGCLWTEKSKFMVFGNRHGSLVEDYNRRLLSWDHVTCIDLEAFGIYQPPRLQMEIPMQELGLAALEDGVLADFDIVCDDGRKIPCSRRILEERWPWFKERRRIFQRDAMQTMEGAPAIAQHVPLPDLPGAVGDEPRPDPRLTSRSFHLSESYPIALAFVQYFYTTALITPVQHAPAVLSQLLLLSSTYDLPHLESLVKHAMHRALSYATSVGIYGVSTLCSCRSLQIRALRVVMAYSQRRPNGSRRQDKDGGGRNDSSGGSDRNGPGGGGGGGSPEKAAARPRGMSDASYMRGSAGGSTSGYPSANGFSNRAATASPAESSSTVTGRPRAMSELAARGGSKPTAHRMRTVYSYDPSSSSGSSKTTGVGLRPARSVDALRSMGSAYAPMERPASMISITTDQELLATAEMLTPVVEAEDFIRDVPRSGSATPGADIFATPVRSRTYKRVSTDMLSLSSSTSTAPSMTYTSENESGADYTSDDFCESAVISPREGSYPGFHLPRQLMSQWESDTPSLTPSVSQSSLSTPALSRTSSFRRTPPVSPTNSFAPLVATSPVRGAQLGPIPESRSPELEERLYDEDPFMCPNNMLASPTNSLEDLGRELMSAGLTWSGPRNSRQLSPYDSAGLQTPPQSPPTSPGRPSRSPFSKLFSRTGDKLKKKASMDQDLRRPQEFSASALTLSLTKAEEKKKRNEYAKVRMAQIAPRPPTAESFESRLKRKNSDLDPTLLPGSMLNGLSVRGAF